jgi:divalent metal cation (Fe/Co/Zn/Cd) transporter
VANRAAAPTDRQVVACRIRRVSWSSLVWLGIEGVVATAAGIATGSVALLGYGLDSAIQSLGSGVIIWRFTGRRITSADAERRAQRVVAASFFLLAPYIAVAALAQLLTATPPRASWVGVALAAIGMILMPVFGRAKRRLGVEAGSAATSGEGSQHLICAALSATILTGLVLNATLGWWWADPVAALILAVASLGAGVRTWRGRGC